MERRRKIVLVANCLLNTNAKVEGISTIRGASPLIIKLVEAGYGIIQLPCVEMAMFGCQRWGIVYEQCDFPAFRRKCRELLSPILEQIKDFAMHGYEIKAVVGADGSPNCAVNTTCSGTWGGEFSGSLDYNSRISSITNVKRMGVMMEELQLMLLKYNLDIPFCAVSEDDMSSYEGISDILF